MHKKPAIDLKQACKRAAQLIRERGLAKETYAACPRHADPLHQVRLGCGKAIALAEPNYAVCILGGLALAINEQDPDFDRFPSVDDIRWPEGLEALACTLSDELPPADQSGLEDYGKHECLAQLVALNDRLDTTAEMMATRLEKMAEAAPHGCC
jgi:hypothetical protein